MEIKKVLHKQLVIVVTLISFVFIARPTYASSGSISIIPASGTYEKGSAFTAAVKIEGGGTAFNASKAKVDVSQNIIVEGLTLGDCDFALVQTPSIESLSFAGVILGGYKDKCTLYTLRLKATTGESGFVFISEASIRSYKGALEVLSKVNNSSYTFINSASNNPKNNGIALSLTPTHPPLSFTNGIKLYTLAYNINNSGKSLNQSLRIILDQGQANEMLSTPQLNDSDPTVLTSLFENVPQGVHVISVMNDKTLLSKQVINIKGSNREITLGVTPNSSIGSSVIWLIALAIVMVAIITGGAFMYMIIWRKNHPIEI